MERVGAGEASGAQVPQAWFKETTSNRCKALAYCRLQLEGGLFLLFLNNFSNIYMFLMDFE